MPNPPERIFLSKADITEVERNYVMDALQSGWVTLLGPSVDEFEEAISARVGVAHALALS
jgi:dTDP-4-amino-4,6-dideoxygalactose transaminase